ncbi:MAG: hypothetical protein J5892_00050 [Bacilli bacterium]|nr:hypothetical protein [Bacilli bacterium]
MDNQQYIEYFYQHGIDDITYDNDIISNGMDSVNITKFDLKSLADSPKFVNDLELNRIDSTLLINIIKARILASEEYERSILAYMSMQKPNLIPPTDFLQRLAQTHFHLVQAYSYLTPEIQQTVDNLSIIIDKPQTMNDQSLQDAYYSILQTYENQNQSRGKTHILKNGNVNYYDDDEKEVNEFGFVSIAAIALIIINLGVIIATFIINH